MDNQSQNTPTPTPPQPGEMPTPQPEKKGPAGKQLLLIGLLLIILVAAVSLAVFNPFAAPPSPTPLLNEASPQPQPLTLSLTSPTDGETAVNSEILVRGKTLPNTTVSVFTEGDQEMVESDANGNFETTLTLHDGINSVNVTAFGEDGEEKTTSLDVVYDSEG